MTSRIPLPPDLRNRPFPVSTAIGRGIGPGRLRGPDLDRPFHGVRQVGKPADADARCRAYLQRMPPDGFFSSVTAALVMRIPLPLWLERRSALDVAVPWPGRGPRGRNVAGHKLRIHPGDVRDWNGLPITSPERTWCDLAPLLTLPELVAAGDFLIHWRLPFTTVPLLTLCVATHHGRRGKPLLREALPILHDRAESPRESHLRVLLVRAGFDGLEINYPIALPSVNTRYRADFAIPRHKVIIEYQGDYHRDPKQWRADMTRLSRLEAHGWSVVQVNADDLNNPGELVERIRLVIAARSA